MTERTTGFLGTDWIRALRDLVIVVLGILVAFSLDAWWSQRADQAQERSILEGLYAEFSANLESLEATMTEHRRTLDDSRQLLQLIGPVSEAHDAEQLDSLVACFLVSPSFDPTTGNLSALLSSGTLHLISNDSLRVKVAAWKDMLIEMKQEEAEAELFIEQQILPFLFESFPLRTMDARSPVCSSGNTADSRMGYTEGVGQSSFQADYSVLLTSLKFENMVDDRRFTSRFILGKADAVQAETEEIISLLQAELEND